MKVWIDLRFLNDNLLSKFIIKLVILFLKEKKDIEFTLYTNSELDLENLQNYKTKRVNIENWSIKEQINFNKILKSDNNDLMIFFNHYKPILYKREYITFVLSLKDIYYINFDSYFKKYKFLFLIEKNLKNSSKIICLDENTKKELIEKFDIIENKINIIPWFFPNWIEDNSEKIELNIKTKYSIKNDFFIYSWWDSIEKNYEKLIQVIKRLKENWKEVDLVFLWNSIWSNVNLRKLILENHMESNTYFLWSIEDSEKKYFYKECIATIFPSFYEPFPFRLNDPIKYWSHIISSKLINIENIFWDKIKYFSPISANSIYTEIYNFIDNKNKKTIDYKFIWKNYNEDITLNKLLEIIK